LSGLTPEENSPRPSVRNSRTDSFSQQKASGDTLLLLSSLLYFLVAAG
jgi:hypothetical protein